jgi:ATP-dependent Lon protease
MEDSERNRTKMVQFVAQEIAIDKRIPPASREAVKMIIEESRRRAKEMDNKDHALTLRLRELGGLIRAAGDLAVMEHSPAIEGTHIARAIKIAKSAEQQIKDRYGSYFAGQAADVTEAQKSQSPYHYWNYHPHDDRTGYK